MSLLQLFTPIRAFAFDMDGVLTDGSVLLLETGEQLRRMNIKDGYAIQLAVRKGYPVAVVSGARSEGARLRLQKLGVESVFMGVENKEETLTRWLAEKERSWDELLFMGDDVPDLKTMLRAGISAAPADAVPEIRQAAKYISACRGGEACVRDVIEKVLKLNGHWDLESGIASR